MSRKKLLFIAHAGGLEGGGERSLLELIKDARSRGYAVSVVVPSYGDLAKPLEQLRARTEVVPFTFWRSDITGKSMVNIQAVTTIRQIAVDYGADCIISNSSVVPWGALAAASANIPHAWIAREFPFDKLSYLSEYYGFMKAYSNLLIANSSGLARFITKVSGGKKIPNFYPFVDEKKLKLNKSLSNTRLINIGAIYELKNQRQLIEAVAQLRQKGLKIKVLLIGPHQTDDPYCQQLIQIIADNGMQKQVKLVGYHQNPFSLVGPNDIYVHTSLSESFGRVIIEATKLGLVCVSADNSGGQEISKMVKINTYNSADPTKLARLLEEILSEFNTYRIRAQATQKSAREKLSLQKCHDNFFNELEKVFGQPNPRGELQSMLPELAAVDYVNNEQRKQILNLEKSVQKLDQHLTNIINSKSWKMVLKIRRLLRR